MSFISIAIAAASGGASLGASTLSAFGQAQAGKDAYRAAHRKANRVIIDSKFKINDIERTRIRTIANQKASYIASGVKLSGSPLEVMAETNYYAGVDKARTQYEARVMAEEIRTGASSELSASKYAVGGALIGGVGKSIGAAGSGYSFGQSLK